MKNYWDGRSISSSNTIGSLIKRSRLTREMANIIFSVRTADEVFVSRVLRERRVKSVLDVACGLGKAVIPSIAEYTAGVDILGYPMNIALGKGYNECVQYEPPDYNFEISRQVDVVTLIHLNAHISFETYCRIFARSLAFLRPGGVAIMVNEYNNDGVSYKLMRRNSDRFNGLVKRMEHWYLEYEKSFIERFQIAFDELKLIRRRPLIAGLLPSLHYHDYCTERNPSSIALRAFILSDIPLSVINYFQSHLSPRFNKCFTVGYVYEKR